MGARARARVRRVRSATTTGGRGRAGAGHKPGGGSASRASWVPGHGRDVVGLRPNRPVVGARGRRQTSARPRRGASARIQRMGLPPAPAASVPSFVMSDGPHGVRRQPGDGDHLGSPRRRMRRAPPRARPGRPVALGSPRLRRRRAPSTSPSTQELRRMASAWLVDGRAVREICLTALEIVVREASPRSWAPTTASTAPAPTRTRTCSPGSCAPNGESMGWPCPTGAARTARSTRPGREARWRSPAPARTGRARSWPPHCGSCTRTRSARGAPPRWAQGARPPPPWDRPSSNTASMGPGGEAFADAVTMIISAAVSFWVFFPVLKVVLRDDPAPDQGGRADEGAAAQ